MRRRLSRPRYCNYCRVPLQFVRSISCRDPAKQRCLSSVSCASSLVQEFEAKKVNTFSLRSRAWRANSARARLAARYSLAVPGGIGFRNKHCTVQPRHRRLQYALSCASCFRYWYWYPLSSLALSFLVRISAHPAQSERKLRRAPDRHICERYRLRERFRQPVVQKHCTARRDQPHSDHGAVTRSDRRDQGLQSGAGRTTSRSGRPRSGDSLRQ
eukprot:COSAG04_NODE_7815_length_1063_cov_0.943983_2_plen_214_part_00